MSGGRTGQVAWLLVAGALAAAALGNGFGCGMRVPDDPLPGGGGAGPTTSTSGSAGNGTGGGTGGGGGEIGADQVAEDFATDKCPDPNRDDFYVLGVSADPIGLEGATKEDEVDDDYSSFCGGGASAERRDVVYSMKAGTRGTLTLEASSSMDPPVVYVESECGVRTTFGLPPDQLPCLDELEQQIRLGVTDGQKFYVIVEGDGPDGAYAVNVQLTEPRCGDGVINPDKSGQGELCDLGSGGAGGGVVAGSGCDENCRFEIPEGDEDLCPGIPLTAGQPTQGHTLGFADDVQPPCGAPGGPDRFYYLALQPGDQLHVSVEADFDVVLAVMEACGELQPSHCQDSAGVSMVETLDFTASSSAVYIIAVDGYDAASWGSFTLTATKS